MGFEIRKKKKKKKAVWCICVVCEVQSRCNITPLLRSTSAATSCYVTIRTYRTRFLFIYSVYWYWSHSNSCFIFLPASGPIVLVDSCAAHCCDSELRLTVHCCALWHYCSCNAYCSRYPIVLLQYISQACWVLCSPRLDFFHRTVISTLVAANRLRSSLPSWLIHSKLFIATSISDTPWLTTSHQKLSKSSSWT